MWWQQLERFLPITVLGAMTVFFLREFFEWIRRSRAESRKKKALRSLLTRECELNYWVYEVLFRIAQLIQADQRAGSSAVYSVSRLANDAINFRRSDSDGFDGRVIPATKLRLMEKLMIEAASIDAELFAVLEPAFDAMIEMEHVRQTLFEAVDQGDEETAPPLIGIHTWMLPELADSFAAMRALYMECAGKELTEWRVR